MADYDRYSELDPAKLRREIEGGYGLSLPASIADSQEAMCRRVNDANPGTVSNYGLSDPHLMCSQLSAGGTYAPSAVHFDGSTWLRNAGIENAPTPNTAFSFSVWLNVVWADQQTSEPLIYIVDPESSYDNFFDLLNTMPHPRTFDFFTGDTATGSLFTALSSSGPLISDGWHHFLGSAEAGTAIKLLIDGVEAPNDSYQRLDEFVIDVSGKSLWVGSDGSASFVGDMMDFWIAPNQSLLDGSHTIPEAALRKFLSPTGKPVSLGSDGSLPTGAAPTVFLSGDKDGFLVNRGRGGDFALHGALTDAAPPT